MNNLQPREEGYNAFSAGKSQDENPYDYDEDYDRWLPWDNGWLTAEIHARKTRMTSVTITFNADVRRCDLKELKRHIEYTYGYVIDSYACNEVENEELQKLHGEGKV